MPASSRLPVRRKIKIAAIAAIGKARKKPMTMMAIKPMISKTMRSHRKVVLTGAMAI